MQAGRSASRSSSANGRVGSDERSKRSKTGRTRASQARLGGLDEDEARRALATSKKLYYRIGEVSELTGVKAHVLRYWETEFRWMAPPKSRSKQRLYRKRDIEFVWLLKKLLWDQRYTIAGARQRIQELGLDEALARCADDDSLGAALLSAGGLEAAAPLPARASRPDRSPSNDSEAPIDEAAAGEHAGTQDWVGLRVALESMQSELLELRGVLQQGL